MTCCLKNFLNKCFDEFFWQILLKKIVEEDFFEENFFEENFFSIRIFFNAIFFWEENFFDQFFLTIFFHSIAKFLSPMSYLLFKGILLGTLSCSSRMGPAVIMPELRLNGWRLILMPEWFAHCKVNRIRGLAVSLSSLNGLPIPRICHPWISVKFIYSEKATKFCEISTLLLTGTTQDKSKVEISQNFVAFSEYMNFIISCEPNSCRNAALSGNQACQKRN